MRNPAPLFEKIAKYCIDTNVLFNFWKIGPDEPYGKDVFKSQWASIDIMVENGQIVTPIAVLDEIMEGKDKKDPLKSWAKNHLYMFIGLDDDQVAAMAPIVSKFKIYNDLQKGDYPDLCVVALAKARRLKVITSEKETVNTGKKNPHIPNVCKDQGVDSMSVVAFLREENISY